MKITKGTPTTLAVAGAVIMFMNISITIFLMGFGTEVQAPDYEERIAIMLES